MTPTQEDHESAARRIFDSFGMQADISVCTCNGRRKRCRECLACIKGIAAALSEAVRVAQTYLVDCGAGEGEPCRHSPETSPCISCLTDQVAELREAVRVAVEGEREANCFLVCWWCGNDYGIWEGTPVRFGPDDWKHRSKADPTRVIDCSASRLRNRAPMSKFGLGQAWVSKVTGDDTTEPSVLGAGLSQKDGSDAQATPAPACLMENPCTHAAEVARRGGCIDCHRNEIGLCAKHRGTPPETGEK